MLQIVFKDGSSRTWQENQYTDYEYLTQVFVVIRGDQWIGVYNMDSVKSVEYIVEEIKE